MKIGVLDWGIGGCGLISKLESAGIDFVYLSDSGYEPYGKVPKEKLQQRVESCTEFLNSHQVDMIAIACNAASTVIDPDDSTLTIIDYGKSIITNLPKDSKIGVIGGHRLVESNVLSTINFPGHDIKQIVAQNLSAHIEAGNQNSKDALNDLQIILNQLGGIKHLVLACTHYIAMDKEIIHLSPFIHIHDPAEMMAREIKSRIAEPKINSDQLWFTTGSGAGMINSAKLAFNVHIGKATEITI